MSKLFRFRVMKWLVLTVQRYSCLRVFATNGNELFSILHHKKNETLLSIISIAVWCNYSVFAFSGAKKRKMKLGYFLWNFRVSLNIPPKWSAFLGIYDYLCQLIDDFTCPEWLHEGK